MKLFNTAIIIVITQCLFFYKFSWGALPGIPSRNCSDIANVPFGSSSIFPGEDLGNNRESYSEKSLIEIREATLPQNSKDLQKEFGQKLGKHIGKTPRRSPGRYSSRNPVKHFCRNELFIYSSKFL